MTKVIFDTVFEKLRGKIHRNTPPLQENQNTKIPTDKK